MIFLEDVNDIKSLSLLVHKHTLRSNGHNFSLEPLKYCSEYLENPPGELDPTSPLVHVECQRWSSGAAVSVPLNSAIEAECFTAFLALSYH